MKKLVWLLLILFISALFDNSFTQWEKVIMPGSHGGAVYSICFKDSLLFAGIKGGVHVFKIGFVEGKRTTTENQIYAFIDNSVNGKIFYRLKQIDYDGSYEYSRVLEASTNPLKFTLKQNFPNPFNPSTTIKYEIPKAGVVTLKIYDILGREVRTLIDEEKNIGRYEVKFDASELSSGMYIYQIKVNDFISSKKMLLIK